MSLEILDAGLLTTLQDLGRRNSQKYGVTVGGAMDTFALRMANRLVGNPEDYAALEIGSSGVRLLMFAKSIVAVTGARFSLTVDERPVPMNTALFVRPSQVLEFGALLEGVWAYLAVNGGFDVPFVLGSRSTDLRGIFGGFNGRALRSGDQLNFGDHIFKLSRAGTTVPANVARYYESTAPLAVLAGPHGEYFEADAFPQFLKGEFTIGEFSDRMGLRLHGHPVTRVEKELMSCGVTRGVIQVPPDGQPIALMADHQTAGGYPIIATVIQADLPRLAQKSPGDKISFRETTLEEAISAREELMALTTQVL